MSHNIMNIIPFNNSYEFTFLEEKINISHPVSKYFLKLNDLSINLVISLKWILWDEKFFSSISEKIKEIDYPMHDLINNALQSDIKQNIEKKHILLIDNNKIENTQEVLTLIEVFYSKEIFDENIKIHLKLKLNLREYLLISEVLYPTFIKWDKIEIC